MSSWWPGSGPASTATGAAIAPPRRRPTRTRPRAATTSSSAVERQPARERAPERDLVGVLEVGADRQPAGEARDGDAVAQQIGDVVSGRLARGGGIRGDDELLHPAGVDAPHEFGDLQVLGVDPIDR